MQGYAPVQEPQVFAIWVKKGVGGREMSSIWADQYCKQFIHLCIPKTYLAKPNCLYQLNIEEQF
jgi:hypothetical protein